MTIVLWVAVGLLAAAAAVAGHRMLVGPDDANRAAGSDLLFFAVIGLFAVLGALFAREEVFDLVLVATTVGFIASLSLARAITRGRR